MNTFVQQLIMIIPTNRSMFFLATAAFVSPSYDVTEGDQVEICVVLFAPLGSLSSNFSMTLQTIEGTKLVFSLSIVL